jgi:hypothetical protein
MTNLKAAVAAAFDQAQHDLDEMNIDVASHLMAQRRVYSDGSTEWAVRFSDSFDSDWMTHLFSTLSDCAGTIEEIAHRIEATWSEDWDEVEKANPVGNFAVGSSDFITRSEI